MKRYQTEGAWRRFADATRFGAWRRRLRAILALPELPGLSSSSRDAAEEVLGQAYDDQLFVKVAFNTKKSGSDAALRCVPRRFEAFL